MILLYRPSVQCSLWRISRNILRTPLLIGLGTPACPLSSHGLASGAEDTQESVLCDCEFEKNLDDQNKNF